MPDEGKPATPTPELPLSPLAQDDLEQLKAAAIALVQRCVRNTQLEDLHAGITPASQSGSYDDVKVVSPYGEIPWMRGITGHWNPGLWAASSRPCQASSATKTKSQAPADHR